MVELSLHDVVRAEYLPLRPVSKSFYRDLRITLTDGSELIITMFADYKDALKIVEADE
jgi:hypothetical protein